MTRDEYILKQFKDNIALNRALLLVDVIAGVASILMAIAAVAMGKPAAIGAIAPLTLFFIVSGMSARDSVKSFTAGLEEIEANPVDIYRSYNYSPKTAKLISSVQLPEKTLLSQMLAYGICALMLLVGGVIIVAVSEGEAVLIIAGAIALAMGLGLTVLTVKAGMNWRTTRQLDESLEDEA